MRRLDNEDGAVAVFVGICILMLIGFAAFAVDVGALYQEKRELQNGADAAALAGAQDCAYEVVPCTIDGAELNITVDNYANYNANDGASNAEIVDLQPTADPPYITVQTTTSSNGESFLRHWFAWVLDHPTSTVVAEATATWGHVPGTLEIFPLAFCLDTFNTLTSNGTAYGPPEYHVFYTTPSNSVECPTTDEIYSGGFGWLDISDPSMDVDPTTCTITVSYAEWLPGRTGEGLLNSDPWPNCVQKLKDKIVEMDSDPTADPLLVPIFDGWRNPGANGEFHIAGFGALRPTGYNFGGAQSYPDNSVCVAVQNRCVRGWFTEFVTLDGLGDGGNDYGVVTVKLTQ